MIPNTIPLRLCLIVPFVIQTIGTVGLVGYLSFRNGESAVQQMASELRQATTQRVEQHLEGFLQASVSTVETNAIAATLGQLQMEDWDRSRRYFLKQLQVLPNIDGLYIGNEQGQFLCACGSEEFGVVEKTVVESPQRELYRLNPEGDRQALLKLDTYDPRLRPWYLSTQRYQATNWSDIYAFTDGSLGITAAAPIYDPTHQTFLGVAGADVRLQQIGEFLQALPLSAQSEIFIVERSGLLVASSEERGLEPAVASPENPESQRIEAIASHDPRVQATARYVQDHLQGFGAIRQPQSFDFNWEGDIRHPEATDHQGDRQFVQILPYQHQRGLDWLIVVVVPEQDFMGQIQANTRTTLQLCGAALGVSILSGMILARLLSAPIQRFSRAAYAISAGNLAPVEQRSRIREVEILTRSFNRMTRNLQASFQALEEANSHLEERVVQRTAELQSEKEKSEQLLLNILPRKIAEQLKNSQEPIAKSFEEVSILFADIVGFTPLASEYSATKIVQLLNELFCRFDALAERHGLEKIKTIGDAYMVAAGLPEERVDHAEAIATMALDMRTAVQDFSRQVGLDLALRIGINSGMVVGGVIGKKKFIYDLWGDTVNIASRMESSGEAHCIQLSEATYARLRPDTFRCEARGEITVKGKGRMNTYWLLDQPSVPEALLARV